MMLEHRLKSVSSRSGAAAPLTVRVVCQCGWSVDVTAPVGASPSAWDSADEKLKRHYDDPFGQFNEDGTRKRVNR